MDDDLPIDSAYPVDDKLKKIMEKFDATEEGREMAAKLSKTLKDMAEKLKSMTPEERQQMAGELKNTIQDAIKTKIQDKILNDYSIFLPVIAILILIVLG